MNIVNILMNEFAVDEACDVLSTDGLGPCIGIAVAYNGRFSLLHDPGPSMSTTADEFLEALESTVPRDKRAPIRPVVAGGKVSHGSKVAVMKERAWVLKELRRLGFGPPMEHWCPESADSQDLKLDAHANAISVTTSGGPAESCIHIAIE